MSNLFYIDYNINHSNIEILFNDGKFFYHPYIIYKLNQSIPEYSTHEPQSIQSLVISLPYINKEWKDAFFYRNESQIIGFFNICTHIKVPLDLDDSRFFNQMGFITCRIHGAQYCPKTGRVVSGPARSPLVKIMVEEISFNENSYLQFKGFYRES